MAARLDSSLIARFWSGWGVVLGPPGIDLKAFGHRFFSLRKAIRQASWDRLASDLRAICECLAGSTSGRHRLARDSRATREHDELTASIGESTMEVSSDTTPQSHSSDSSEIRLANGPRRLRPLTFFLLLPAYSCYQETLFSCWGGSEPLTISSLSST